MLNESPWRQPYTVPSFVNQSAAVDLVIVCSDLHTNSTSGLRTPEMVRMDGRKDVAQDLIVKHLWEPWVKHAADVAAEKERLSELVEQVRVILILNGDGPDKNVHDPFGYELVTMEDDEIVRMTIDVLKILEPIVDVWVFNRGTKAHEGAGVGLMEGVAREMDRLSEGKVLRCKQTETETLSWYSPRLIVQGVDIIAAHHPLSGARRRHTRVQAATRTAFDHWAGFARIGDKWPDLMLFGHVHFRADSGVSDACPVRALYTPSWKLPGSYVYRIGMGVVPEPVGSWWVMCSGGEYQHRAWGYQPPAQEGIIV